MRIRRRGPSPLVTPPSSFPITHQTDPHASPDAAAPPLPTVDTTKPQDKEEMLQDLDLTKESRDSRPLVGGSPETPPCAIPPPPDSTSVQVMKDEEKEAMRMVPVMDFGKSSTGARNKRKASCGTVEEEKGNAKVEAMGNVDASCDVGGDAAASLFQEEKGAENAESVRRLGDIHLPVEKPRCRRTNGRGWRCRRDALLGYSLCECHIAKGRLLAIMAQENDPQATTNSMPAVSKTTADAATSTVESQKETGPSSQTPAAGEKRSKASTPRERLMSSIIDQKSNVPVPSSKSQASSVEGSSPVLALAPSSNNGVAGQADRA